MGEGARLCAALIDSWRLVTKAVPDAALPRVQAISEAVGGACEMIPVLQFTYLDY